MGEIGDGGAWGDWIRSLGSQIVSTAAQVEVLESRQVGEAGLYREGQAGSKSVAGISQGTVLLIGAALVAFLLLKG